MILIFSSFITNQRSNNRYSRYDIFKYTLNSYKDIPFTDIYLFILLDNEFKHLEYSLTEYIYTTFSRLSKDKINITYDRYVRQSQWLPFINYIVEKHGIDELAWFTQNDDHVFVDYNMDIVNEGIELLKKDPAEHKSIYLSHWPEILKMSGKYQEPILINNYVKFDLSLLDSIQIFNLKLLYYVFGKYKWKNDHIRIDSVLNELTSTPSEDNPLSQTIYVPLREICRHFDGYDHVRMDRSACGPLELPSNTFSYTKDKLIAKMTAKHHSFWAFNNNFNIPQKWIDINLSLHNNVIEHSIPDNSIKHNQNIIRDNNYKKHYRAVMLVLASNNNQIYKNFRKIWKAYMNVDPSIKVFFVYGHISNKDKLDDYDKESDIIFPNIPESYPVLINKTIQAMKFIHQRFTYDFFIRTNLSTFWDFKKLHLHLNELPTKNCYSGDGPLPGYNSYGYYLSGTDTIVTPEMIDSIIRNEHLVDYHLVEDGAMGKYFHKFLGVPMLPNRICFFEDILSINELDKINKRIDNAIINNRDHYRVKTLNGNREEIDMFISTQLLKKIYNIS